MLATVLVAFKPESPYINPTSTAVAMCRANFKWDTVYKRIINFQKLIEPCARQHSPNLGSNEFDNVQ